MKRLLIDVKTSEHDLIRIKAFNERKSVKKVIEEIITQYLSSNKPSLQSLKNVCK